MATEKVGLDTLDSRVLVGHDYDKTIARTDDKLPGGYTVEEAYEYGVKRVLGPLALQIYQDTGGLRNRAPSDIIDQLMPQGEAPTRRQRVEDLVQAKLEVLTPQIGRYYGYGKIWPPLSDGFNEYWSQVSSWPEATTAITSSGHESFILKSFEVHDIAPPDILVTDDDMRPLIGLLPRAVCEKPSRLLIDMMAHRWLLKIGYVEAANFSLEDLTAIISRHAIFAGDDPDKDGKTAYNAGVPFIHIAPEDSFTGFQLLRKEVMTKILELTDVV